MSASKVDLAGVVPDLGTTPLSESKFLGHPRGLATLFFMEMWERFTYYGMRALLILFMTAPVGLALPVAKAGEIYGLFTAGVYLFSLPGGWIADRLIGQRRAVLVGGLLIALGNFLAAMPGAPLRFFASLGVIAIGVGLLKPNVSVMVGELYHHDPPARRDAGFSIFYFGIYVGAFAAPLIAGTIGEEIGFRWGFTTAGIAMLIGVAQYVRTGRFLGEIGAAPDMAPRQRRRNWRIATAVAVALLLLLASMITGPWSLSLASIVDALGGAMALLTVLFFGYVLRDRELSSSDRKRIIIILFLFAGGALFPAGLEQAGSTMTLFARDYTDRSLFGSFFASGQHPVSWYLAIEPVFVLLLAPLFAMLWPALAKRGWDPPTLAKFGIAMLLLGASFVVMALAAVSILHSHMKAGPAWLFATYVMQTVGELFLSPIGLSRVSRLSPKRYAGQLMGTWFLAAAIGGLIAGVLGGDIGASALPVMPPLFLGMAATGLAAGVIMLAVARPLRSWES